MSQVKGPAIIGARDWLDAKLGAGHFIALAREIEPQLPERILPGDWYPLRPLVHALERSVASVDGHDSIESLVTMLAGESARADLRGIYRAFLWVASPRMFLRQAPKIWANYTDVGRIEELDNEPGRFAARLHEVPREFVDWAAGAWQGFLPPAIELAGGKNPRASVASRNPGRSGAWELRYELRYD